MSAKRPDPSRRRASEHLYRRQRPVLRRHRHSARCEHSRDARDVGPERGATAARRPLGHVDVYRRLLRRRDDVGRRPSALRLDLARLPSRGRRGWRLRPAVPAADLRTSARAVGQVELVGCQNAVRAPAESAICRQDVNFGTPHAESLHVRYPRESATRSLPSSGRALPRPPKPDLNSRSSCRACSS